MAVRVHHLKGADAWLRCDHDGTRLHAATGTLRLAEIGPGGTEAADPAPWTAAWGGAAAWVLGDVAAGTLEARAGAWHAAPPHAGPLRELAGDACGHLWVLSESGLHARAHAGDRTLDLPLPIEAHRLAAARDGLYVAGPTGLWFGRWGRPWRQVPLPAHLDVVDVAARDAHATALGRLGGRTVLLRLAGARVADTSPIDVPSPVSLVVLEHGDVLVPVVSGPPPRRTRLDVFTWTEVGANRTRSLELGRFDGRGLLEADGVVWGSTPTGWIRGWPVRVPVRPEGCIETFALDSERFGCVWHRVFLDVCLPEGTSVRVWARTSDQRVTEFLAGDPRPRLPQGADAGLGVRDDLGSRSEEEVEGWVDVGHLDLQPLRADAPAPFRGALPALDPLPRGQDERTAATHTLEGLLKNPPGRYLWLRVELFGRRSASPVLAGIRAHAPRPSLLAFLPAWWRDDPDSQQMEELLALFEAPLSRLEDRIDALPALFDPRATPPEALDWLAGFVGLAFEPQLPERVRRTLLAEAAALYRRRGTTGALTRLCEILTEAPVRIVEGWQTRAALGGTLGDGATMGRTLQLGGGLEADSDDAIRAWFAEHAHRFTVVVHRPCTPALRDLLDRAIERHKPAHTLHTLCFADALQTGAAAVGVTTSPRAGRPPDAAVAGDEDRALLGATTLARAPAPLPSPPVLASLEES